MAVGFRISIAEREEMSHGETWRDLKVVDVVGVFGSVAFRGGALKDGEVFRTREGAS